MHGENMKLKFIPTNSGKCWSYYVYRARVLTHLIRQRAPSSELLLYHNNAHPHDAATTIETILNLKSEVQLCPPQSRDFAPCDFHSFGSLKETSLYHRFCNDEEVKGEVLK